MQHKIQSRKEFQNFILTEFNRVEKEYNAVKHLSGTRPSYLRGQLDILNQLKKIIENRIQLD